MRYDTYPGKYNRIRKGGFEIDGEPAQPAAAGCIVSGGFTGDMRLLTCDGYVPFAELSLAPGTMPMLIDANGSLVAGKVLYASHRPTVGITLLTGKRIRCVMEQSFMICQGHEVAAHDLFGKRLRLAPGSDEDEAPLVLAVTPAGKDEDVYAFAICGGGTWGCVEGHIARCCVWTKE